MGASVSAVVLKDAGEAIRRRLVVTHAHRIIRAAVACGESTVTAGARAAAYISRRLPATTDEELHGIEALFVSIAEDEVKAWREMLS